ncbi:M23 family metallopeptidase [Aureimonas psammosilenae]|uniref:M23 family metallopeptidase n=1 Tax=Aureimonas psammosilenae TaxID=2495496 RepID=UPI00186A260B|nr:M23 family metallopeptidase [Aureimonas psammosilenae]
MPRTVILAKGDEMRHFVLKPWAIATSSLALGCAMAGLFAFGFWSADSGRELPSIMSGDRQLAAVYETRIASLRSEVERLTTRSFVDQAKVASKVDLLLLQQAELSDRYTKLQPLLQRAETHGLVAKPIASPEPCSAPSIPDGVAAYAEEAKPAALDRFKLVDASAGKAKTAPEPISPDLVRRIGQAIDEAELEQIESVGKLAKDARKKSEAIGSVLRTEGLAPASTERASPGKGGPFVPVPQDRLFDASLEELAGALDVLQAVRSASSSLPLAKPNASNAVSSNFGVRVDPFLGQAAMHTGVDFAAEPGSPVAATAPGEVVFAGENGGYGNMVEVRHADGVSTRYAHLSSILVTVGAKVSVGSVVGRVGSTGRSTGPHLHYEIRRAGEAVDPTRYLRAGRRIEALG